MADILLDVKTAIIKILKNANTIADDNVREGLTIALNNPFSKTVIYEQILRQKK